MSSSNRFALTIITTNTFNLDQQQILIVGKHIQQKIFFPHLISQVTNKFVNVDVNYKKIPILKSS